MDSNQAYIESHEQWLKQQDSLIKMIETERDYCGEMAKQYASRHLIINENLKREQELREATIQNHEEWLKTI